VRLTGPSVCRERRAPVPPDQWLDVARRVKEAHCYVCSDVAKVNKAARRYSSVPRCPAGTPSVSSA
jgi:hypothetical protein